MKNTRRPCFRPVLSLCLAVLLAGAARAADEITLKIDWPKGKVITRRMENNQKQEMQMPGMPSPMVTENLQTQDMSMTVRGAGDSTDTLVEVEYLNMKMSMKSAMFNMEYDSESETNDANNPMAAMGKMVGQSFTLIYAEDGTLKDVEGIDKMAEAIGGGNPMMKQMLNKESMRQMVNPGMVQAFNGETRKMGDTWPMKADVQVPMMGTMKVEMEYTYARNEALEGRDCAVLTFEGTMRSDGISEVEVQPGMAMKMQIKDGTMEGTIWWDDKAHLDIAQEIRQKMTMEMQMPGAGGESQTIVTKQDGVMKQSTLSIKDAK